MSCRVGPLSTFGAVWPRGFAAGYNRCKECVKISTKSVLQGLLGAKSVLQGPIRCKESAGYNAVYKVFAGYNAVYNRVQKPQCAILAKQFLQLFACPFAHLEHKAHGCGVFDGGLELLISRRHFPR